MQTNKMYQSFACTPQEYEKLKADARERGSGEREEMADVERQLTNSRSKVDQLRSEQVMWGIRPGHLGRCNRLLSFARV